MTVGRFCRFVFVLISWVVMAGAAMADCVSVDEITKCAQIPNGAVSRFNFQAGTATDSTWSFFYKGVEYSGNYANAEGMSLECGITSPFVGTASGDIGPAYSGAYEWCAHFGDADMINGISFISKLDGDDCPDGFYTVPYDVSCGTEMVDVTSDIPDCSEDATGEFCTIPGAPPAVPCALGISELKLSTGFSIPLWAERYTTPALCVGYNGGVCYADALVGQEINTLNIAYNDVVYHLVAQATSGGDTGGGDTGGGNTGGGDTGGGDTGGGDTGGDDNTGGDTGGDDTGGDTGDDVYKFFATTTSDTTRFGFEISSAGTFYVDWGDGNKETIEKSNTSNTAYSHTYGTAGAYTIRIGGRATRHDTSFGWGAISFERNENLASIDGSLGAIFSTLSDGTQPSFRETFLSCSNLTGSIPENLFAGVSGAPKNGTFYWTFHGCRGLTGSIPAGLFAGIKGAPASGMFDGTFSGCSGLTGSIPAGLFAGIKGAPANSMFNGTFSGCSGLTGSIPANLFAGISGAPASYMFSTTFARCSGLTGTIPAGLFAGIKGAPASYMFNNTFWDCSGLTGSIPAGLFAGVSGASAAGMFRSTFSGCSGLTGTIPENLFAGISGAPADSMFDWTFYGCSGLTGTIPENLFAGISGAPADSMFYWTFYGCSGLTGSIPAGLFAGISGAPADSMFYGTFSGCRGLTGSIPQNLFAGISGAPAEDMFWSTFSGCSGLTGSIPAGLFAGISGAPASGMFYGTFSGCSGLTGEIPLGLFGRFTSSRPVSQMFYYTFSRCSGLTGPSARQPDGTYLYKYFNTATSSHVSAMYRDCTGLDDYANIPYVWK